LVRDGTGKCGDPHGYTVADLEAEPWLPDGDNLLPSRYVSRGEVELCRTCHRDRFVVSAAQASPASSD
jgi:hypothetical protein